MGVCGKEDLVVKDLGLGFGSFDFGGKFFLSFVVDKIVWFRRGVVVVVRGRGIEEVWFTRSLVLGVVSVSLNEKERRNYSGRRGWVTNFWGDVLQGGPGCFGLFCGLV